MAEERRCSAHRSAEILETILRALQHAGTPQTVAQLEASTGLTRELLGNWLTLLSTKRRVVISGETIEDKRVSLCRGRSRRTDRRCA